MQHVRTYPCPKYLRLYSTKPMMVKRGVSLIDAFKMLVLPKLASSSSHPLLLTLFCFKPTLPGGVPSSEDCGEAREGGMQGILLLPCLVLLPHPPCQCHAGDRHQQVKISVLISTSPPPPWPLPAIKLPNVMQWSMISKFPQITTFRVIFIKTDHSLQCDAGGSGQSSHLDTSTGKRGFPDNSIADFLSVCKHAACAVIIYKLMVSDYWWPCKSDILRQIDDGEYCGTQGGRRRGFKNMDPHIGRPMDPHNPHNLWIQWFGRPMALYIRRHSLSTAGQEGMPCSSGNISY